METTEKSPLNTGMKYGLYTGMGMIIYSIIFYILGIMPDGAWQLLSYLILIAGIFFGMKYHRDQESGGFMSYGRAFGVGALVSVFCAVIASIYNFIFFAIIDPSYMEKIFQMQEEKLIRQGQSEEQIEMAMKMMRDWSSPAMTAVFGFVGFTIAGIILALIIAAIVKKNKPMFDQVG
jgi:hypothetical protein